MRKIFCLLSFIVFSLNCAFAEEKTESPFKENVQYKVLTERQFRKKEVLLVFSVYCKACYNYDGVFTRIFSDLSKDISIKELHISNMGKFLMAPSKILYLGGDKKYKELKRAMFDLIHRENIKEYSVFLDRILPVLQMTAEDFQEKDNDNAFIDAVNEKEREGVALARNFGIPVLIINNRYAIDIRKVNTVGEMKNLINYLLKFEN